MPKLKKPKIEVHPHHSIIEDVDLTGDKMMFCDPCYIIDDDFIDDVYEHFDCDFEHVSRDHGEWVIYEVTVDGITGYVWGTAWGDGCYPIFTGKKKKKYKDFCTVDGGRLGVFPVEFASKFLSGYARGPQVKGIKGDLKVVEGDMTFGTYTLMSTVEVDWEDESDFQKLCQLSR